MKRIIYLILALCVVSVSFAQKTTGAKIASEVTDYDFGVIKEADGKVSYTFVIRNEGTKPMVITRVISACGCTVPEYDTKPIEAGKTSNIKVTFDPTGRPGPFVKTIAVYSNGKDGSFILRIKGVVE